MRLDCSKLSNKGDLLAIIVCLALFALFGLVIFLAATENTFVAGFLAATITWKWHEWVFKPADRLLNRLWS